MSTTRPLLVAPLLLLACLAHAAEVSVAVAAKFTGPMQRNVPEFEKATGHKLVVA